MSTYLVRMTPLEPFTFGGEKGFRFESQDVEKGRNNTANISYYQTSRELPEQTTIIGMLRYLILRHNGVAKDFCKYTNDDKQKIHELIGESSFSFQNRKILTIGLNKINVHPITNSTNIISGHTIPYANVKIEYDNKSLQASADENGLFEVNIDSIILDNTRVKITSCLNGCFTERKVITPFIGELTLLKATENIPFSMQESSIKPTILPKKNKTVVTVVDSRINSTNWKLYIYYTNPMIEKSGKVLIDSLFFKKFNNEKIALKTNKKLIYNWNGRR